MPSYTSSSDSRIPRGAYGVLWLNVVFVFVVLVVISEIGWRRRGHEPNVNDTKILWCINRQNVYEKFGRKKIVITGNSREQQGIVPKALRDILPEYDVVQLAINGEPSYEVLRDLCLDTAFNGIILFSGNIPLLYPAGENKQRLDYEYARFFHNEYRSAAYLDKRVNTATRSFIQSRLVIASAALPLRRLLIDKWKPKVLHIAMRLNRFRSSRYRACLSPEVLYDMQNRKVVPPPPWRQWFTPGDLKELAQNTLPELAGQLRERGGNVVLIRLPTTGMQWKTDEADTPKALYWDSLATWSCIEAIHFQDYQELNGFDCPDESHLDGTDA